MSETTDVRVGDTWKWGGNEYTITRRRDEGDGWWFGDDDGWFRDADFSSPDTIYGPMSLVSRPEVTPPAGPPSGYVQCSVQGCQRWTKKVCKGGTPCNQCHAERSGGNLELIEKVNGGPDWTPPPAPVHDVVTIPSSLNDCAEVAAKPQSAPVVEAPKCRTCQLPGSERIVRTKTHIIPQRRILCDAHYLEVEALAVERFGKQSGTPYKGPERIDRRPAYDFLSTWDGQP